MKKASCLSDAFRLGVSAVRARPTKIQLAVLILIAVGLCKIADAGQLPAVTITSLLSTRTTANGQLIEVPAHPEVVVSIYEIPPNAALPIHEHPFQRYAYVLAGTIEVTVLGGKTYRYKAGDFIAEIVAQWHSGRTIGHSPVRLLVIDQVVPGHSNTIFQDHDGSGAGIP